MADAASRRFVRPGAWARVGWAVATFLVVHVAVCGLAVLPVAVAWQYLLQWPAAGGGPRLLLFSLAAVPSYVLFALLLMVLSAGATKLAGWRTPADATLRTGDLDWPLLTWVRYVAAIRVVRMLAGTLFCGSPIWTAYLRLNGARIGRRVYVNSTLLSDHNLLEFGDDVIIGADVHLAGHTVEAGLVKTGRVRLGAGVTVGLGSAIDIDVEAGPGCQIGALSFVPKHARLKARARYVGIPVRKLAEGKGKSADSSTKDWTTRAE
jgi:serine acetyltransferase